MRYEVSSPYRRCPCCGLNQPLSLDATGVTARVCAQCTHHQGDQETKQLQRAERHERMLRERLTACRDSESKAQAAVVEARKAAAEAREATAAALRSRANLAARIVEAAQETGRHTCPLAHIAHDQDVIGWARRADQEDRPFWWADH
jgi:septal ring factor EnvC (AmiA/AmiB activator)